MMEMNQQGIRGKRFRRDKVDLMNVGLKRSPVRWYQRHKSQLFGKFRYQIQGKYHTYLGVIIDKPVTTPGAVVSPTAEGLIPSTEVVLVPLTPGTGWTAPPIIGLNEIEFVAPSIYKSVLLTYKLLLSIVLLYLEHSVRDSPLYSLFPVTRVSTIRHISSVIH